MSKRRVNLPKLPFWTLLIFLHEVYKVGEVAALSYDLWWEQFEPNNDITDFEKPFPLLLEIKGSDEAESLSSIRICDHCSILKEHW